MLAEALDRISRDQADVAILYKHFKFAGVTLVTLAEGEIRSAVDEVVLTPGDKAETCASAYAAI